jgi:hypothetical protein
MVDCLADAVTIALTDQALQTRAAIPGEQIRAKDGIARAVELIEQNL